MKTSVRHSLIPPARRPEDTPPLPADLYVEPEEDLLVLGEMLHDVATMGEMLRELPFVRWSYRGNLRVIRGAAVRMADRCAKLLGEVRDAREEAKAVLAEEVAAINVVDREFAEVETPEEEAQRIYEAMADSPNLVKADDVQPPASVSHRKRPGQIPSQLGKNGTREYTITESFVMSTIEEHGSIGTTELIAAVGKKTSATATEINDALAALRRDKKVLTSHVGRGMTNHVAP